MVIFFFSFDFFNKPFIGNHTNPNITAKIANIIPKVAAITPPPTPGPKYA